LTSCDYGLTEHFGLTMPQPNHFIIDTVWFFSPWHIRILAGLAILLLAIAWRRRIGWDDLVLWLAAACLGCLSFGVIPFQRYALPVVMLSWFLSALGLIWLLDLLRHRPGIRAVAATGLALGIVLLQWPVYADTLNQFKDDSRDRVAKWAAGNLPAGSRMLVDSYTALGNRPEWSDITVYSHGFFAADAGDLDQLRRRGITYVAICDLSYLRFFTPQTKGAAGEVARYEYCRQWYQRLMKEGKLVWKSVPRHPLLAFTNPTIKVYEMK